MSSRATDLVHAHYSFTDSPSQHILFNTIPPCPAAEGWTELNKEEWGKKYIPWGVNWRGIKELASQLSMLVTTTKLDKFSSNTNCL